MYARTKNWNLDEVKVAVEYDNRSTPRTFHVAIELGGELEDEQMRRLEKVATPCPVRRSVEARHRVLRDHRAPRTPCRSQADPAATSVHCSVAQSASSSRIACSPQSRAHHRIPERSPDPVQIQWRRLNTT
jgi:hypothetical protein